MIDDKMTYLIMNYYIKWAFDLFGTNISINANSCSTLYFSYLSEFYRHFSLTLTNDR